MDLNQQLLPSPQLQTEDEASRCPMLRTHTAVLGSSAGGQTLGSHSGAAVLPYSLSHRYNSRKTLCRAAVAENAQQTKASAGSSSSPGGAFVLGQELVQVEVQIMVKLVFRVDSWRLHCQFLKQLQATHSFGVYSMAAFCNRCLMQRLCRSRLAGPHKAYVRSAICAGKCFLTSNMVLLL